MLQALVTNIQGYSIHDGPGIRTTVFLKGCPLSCRWCANPECISAKVELGFVVTLCTHCGTCATVCPQDAIDFGPEGPPRIDRARCTVCGECVSACRNRARVVHGKMMSVDEVFDSVIADKMFYEPSGGGVTMSGGEPLLQPAFVRALFDRLQAESVHTCIETSGCTDARALLEVLPATDYVLYDLKHMDSAEHRRNTGRPNELILENAKIVAYCGKDFLFRMPLIPGVNDHVENIEATAAFLKGLGRKAERIELMPYHRLGESKYASIGRSHHLHDSPPASAQQVERAKQTFKTYGIECSVSR